MSDALGSRTPRLKWLAVALALAMVQHVAALDAPPACPVGVLICPKPARANLFAMCRRNALLDSYTPGLPT
ncbi:MAG: hypothetical protein ACYC9P_04540, partial [Rudaea sp.]